MSQTRPDEHLASVIPLNSEAQYADANGTIANLRWRSFAVKKRMITRSAADEISVAKSLKRGVASKMANQTKLSLAVRILAAIANPDHMQWSAHAELKTEVRGGWDATSNVDLYKAKWGVGHAL